MPGSPEVTTERAGVGKIEGGNESGDRTESEELLNE